jgi:hypothetical protein
MSQIKIFILAHGVVIEMAQHAHSDPFLTGEEAVAVANEIAEAMENAGVSPMDFIDDAFETHPLWQVPGNATIH